MKCCVFTNVSTFALFLDPPKVLTCVTFDNGHVQGTNGVWVKNDGVKVVSGDCRHNNCGYFDGHSFLSIPFFNNNYHHNGFSVSFFFKGDGHAAGDDMGMISNRCVKSGASLQIEYFDGFVYTSVENQLRNVSGLSIPVSILTYDYTH